MAGNETFNSSIVTARNLGIQKKNRVVANVGIENFLLAIINLHGLSRSDIVNIALEKYLRDENYLNPETLDFTNAVTELEKKIFKKGLF